VRHVVSTLGEVPKLEDEGGARDADARIETRRATGARLGRLYQMNFRAKEKIAKEFYADGKKLLLKHGEFFGKCYYAFTTLQGDKNIHLSIDRTTLHTLLHRPPSQRSRLREQGDREESGVL